MADPAKTIGGLVLVGAGAFLSFIPNPVAGLMISVGAKLVIEGAFGTPEIAGSGTKFSVTSPQSPLPIIYGERKTSHFHADIDSHGTDNSWLDMMVGVCTAGESGKGIEGIEEIWLYNDEKSAYGVTNDNTATGGYIDGVIAKYYDSGAPQWHYIYSIGKGADDQAVDARMESLFPAKWGAGSGIDNQEGRGIVTVLHGFFWDKSEENNIWEKGRPGHDIRYLVRGNLLFDPRYKTSGPDSDGWIWNRADNGSLVSTDNHPGQNPGLQILDYLTSKRYGVGIPYASRDGGTDDEIHEQSFIDFAEHCDEPVTTTGDSPTTLPRYTANAVLSTGDSHKSNLERLLAACNGLLVYENGKFKLLPRKVQTPVAYEIDESQIVGEISVTREGNTVPNIITVRYPSEDHDYELQSYVWPLRAWEIDQNAYLEADNGVPSEKIIDLAAVTDHYHAQHLAVMTLKEMREDAIVEVTCRESAIQLSVGDVVNFTYDTAGWSQKPFRVLSIDINDDSTIKLNLREYDDSVYVLDANSDIATNPGTSLGDPFTVEPPVNLTLLSDDTTVLETGDGTILPRIYTTWDNVDSFIRYTEVQAKRSIDSVWTAFPSVPYTIEEQFISPVDAGTDWDVRIRSVNHLGYVSSWVSQTSHTVTGKAGGPASPTNLLATLIRDIWILTWTPPADVDVAGYEIRHGTTWAGGTPIESIAARRSIAVLLPKFKIATRDLPRGDITLRVKAINGSGVASATDATVDILNWPEVTSRDEYIDDQTRKRPGGDSLARWGPAYDGTGLTRLYDDDGVLGDLTYDDDQGTTVNQRQPLQGASQRNLIEVALQMEDGDSLADAGYTVPTGFTIHSAKYVGGGVEREGNPVWSTDPDALPGAGTEPSRYGPAATFEIASAEMTARLLLREQLTASPPIFRQAAFTDPYLSSIGDETGVAAPNASFLPAIGNVFHVRADGELTSTKSGSFSITLTLQARTDGGIYYPKSEVVIPGTLPVDGLNITRLLSGVISTWDGVGSDHAKVVVEDVSAPGSWSLLLTVGNMYWYQESAGSPLYASMTPGGRKAAVALYLEATS